MTKKRPRDPNQLAKFIVDAATSAGEDITAAAGKAKSQEAVVLGRLGGQRGGRARADKLSPEQRKEIAKAAAAARWSKKKDE